MNRSVSKSRIIKLSALTVSILCLLLNGCGNKNAASSSATEAAAEPAPVTADEKDILGRYVLGIDDRAILEGAKNIDLLARAESMKKVITKIDVDDSAVDTTKPGTYKVKYTVTVDVKNLEKAEAYIEAHPEALTPPAQTAEPAPDAVTEKPTEAEETTAQEVVPSTEETAPAAQETTPADNVQTAVQTDTPAEDTPAGEQAPAEAPEETGPAAEEGGQPAVPADPSTETHAPSTDTGETVTPVIPVIPDEVFNDGTESASGEPAEAGSTIEVVIEKDVTVVTPEEAAEIIEGGGEVWTDESRPVTVEELSGEEAPQTATTQPAKPAEPETGKDSAKETAADTDKEDRQESGPSGSGNQSSGDSHVHNWAERTETVTHEETGHYETVKVGTKTVVDEEAWTESVYEMLAVCDACGYTSDSTEDINNHLYDHYDPDLGYVDAGYSVQNVLVDTIDHPAVTHEEPVYEDKWVVDSEAWSEKKVVGYYCTECGATK